MERNEFVRIRKFLIKTQKQLAQLLGISIKAVQGYEQGWRTIPGPMERQMYLLVVKRTASDAADISPCWDRTGCPEYLRTTCPAWEFRSGDLCWLVCGTICGGVAQDSWESKMERCRECKVLQSVIARIPENGVPSSQPSIK